MISSIFLQWLLAICGMIANGGSGLPLIIALGLIIGRRGNAAFCVIGSRKLAALAICLAIIGAAYYPFALYCQILPYGEDANIGAALRSPAGNAYIYSTLGWLIGIVFLYAGKKAVSRLRVESGDRYNFKFIKWPFIFCCASAFCFLVSYGLYNFPFAGLPEGMEWNAAIMAILRASYRHYFTTFCPAAAIALVFCQKWMLRKEFVAYYKQCINGIVWLAVWAEAGYLPYFLTSWGLVLGASFAANLKTNFALGLTTQVMQLSFLTIALICWLWIIICKNYVTTLSYTALIFLTLCESAPFIVKIYSLLF